MVMHPIKPELDGKDLSSFADPNGKKIFVEFAKIGQAGGGQDERKLTHEGELASERVSG